MKTVLFVAYYFQPSVDAGAKRAEGFFKHLPEHGYDRVLITVAEGNYLTAPGAVAADAAGVVRVREKRLVPRGSSARAAAEPPRAPGPLAGALKRVFRELVYVPDGYRGFYGPACRAALELIGRRPVDVILTTSSPYTSLRIGHQLSRRTGIPWVADFRDLWIENHLGYPYSPAR